MNPVTASGIFFAPHAYQRVRQDEAGERRLSSAWPSAEAHGQACAPPLPNRPHQRRRLLRPVSRLPVGDCLRSKRRRGRAAAEVCPGEAAPTAAIEEALSGARSQGSARAASRGDWRSGASW